MRQRRRLLVVAASVLTAVVAMRALAGRANAPSTTQSSQDLVELLSGDSDVTHCVDAIVQLGTRRYVPAVPAIVRRLDDRRVASIGGRVPDLLVCDLAADALQRMLRINYMWQEKVYFVGTREERDGGIGEWQRWWAANKAADPDTWLPAYVDSLIGRIGGPDKHIAFKAARKLKMAVGSDFAIEAFSDPPEFAFAFEAARLLVADWWATHKRMPPDEWAAAVGPLNRLLGDAVRCRDFWVSSRNPLPRGEIEFMKADDLRMPEVALGDVDALAAQLSGNDPRLREEAMRALASKIGADLGCVRLAESPGGVGAASDLGLLLADWWRTHRALPVPARRESLRAMEVLARMGARYRQALSATQPRDAAHRLDSTDKADP